MNAPASAVVLAAAAAQGVAAPTIYTDRADFDANTTLRQIETFENETLGNTPLPTAFASGLGASFASGSVSTHIGAGSNDFGFQNTTDNGRKYLAFGGGLFDADGGSIDEFGSYSVAFSFGGQTANAFGFDISGVIFNLTAMGFSVTTLNNGQVMDDFFVPSDQVFGVRFYGMVLESAFDEIRIQISSDGVWADYAAFDDVTWAVPAPSTAGLLALGGALAMRRRH